MYIVTHHGIYYKYVDYCMFMVWVCGSIIYWWYGYVDLLYIGGMNMWIFVWLLFMLCGSIIYWWYGYVDLLYLGGMGMWIYILVV